MMPTTKNTPVFALKYLPAKVTSDRYQIGQKSAVMSRNIIPGDGETMDIPVTIVGHVNDDTVIVQFDADDDWRDVLKGEIYNVSTFNLLEG